ncbi:MAG: hypothetical protein WCK57_00775 [Verrucomicrobiae bacterium]
MKANEETKTGAGNSTAAQTLPARFLPLSYKPGAATIDTADGWNFAVVNPLFDGPLRTTAGNLITAAPELLALAKALDQCSAYANGFKLDNLPELMDGFRAMAAAAIAKAEGRSA